MQQDAVNSFIPLVLDSRRLSGCSADLTTIVVYHHAKTALDTERMPSMPQKKDKGVS